MIELIGKPWLAELFAGEGCCDRTHLLVPPWTAYFGKYPVAPRIWRNYWAQLQAVRQHHFDWLISARFDPRESAQLRLLRAQETFGFRSAGGRCWITRDLGLDQRGCDALHRAALAAELAKIILKGGSPGNARFVANAEGEAAARQWLWSQGYRSGVILAVHSGAGNPIRRWREPHFETVLRSLTTPPAMIVFIAPKPTHSSPEGLPAPYAVWQGNLTELKSLLSVCDVFFGTDSGIMHMAAAAGCEVVAVFGPTEPRWYGPFGEHHEVVIVEPMPCRPCFDACIYQSPLCLDQLEDRALAAGVERKLAAARNGTEGRIGVSAR
jgi:heptosyltransferase-2